MKVTVKYEDGISDNLKKLLKKLSIGSEPANGDDKKAKIKCGLQFINFVINGSPNESTIPPIKWGVLRASGSVHVGEDFVGGNNLVPVRADSDVKSMSNTSQIKENSATITIGFNTSYAVKMHESNWIPGTVSQQSGDTGNKFLEKHLKSDGKIIAKMYADIIKKELQ